MTSRTLLNRRMRWLTIPYSVLLSLIPISIASSYVWENGIFAIVLSVGLLIVFFVGFTAQFIAVRCTRCRENLGLMFAQTGTFKVRDKFRFCPYCGVNFDDEILQ